MKTGFALMLILLFFSALLVTQPITAEKQVRTIIVPDDYPTISSAIANATDGDTILVKKGTYETQTPVIEKTIALIGEGAENTTISCHPQWVFTGGFHLNGTGISPDYGWDSAIRITANNVVFSGFRIVSDPSSSFSSSGTATTIASNNITIPITISGHAQNVTGNYINSGIICTGGEKNVISNNQIHNGIYTLASQITISNNTFSGDYGIMMGGYDNMIFNNTIRNTDCALYFWAYAVGNSFYGNNFINNSRQVQIGDVYNSTVATWDNGGVGNYWSDYNGQGVYVINQDNVDHYPLIEPYHVSAISELNLPTTLLTSTIAIAATISIVTLSILLYRKYRKTLT